MKYIQIDSLNDERLQMYVTLNERQLKHINEPDEGYFIVESPRVIERAVNGGYQPVSFLLDEAQINDESIKIVEMFEEADVYVGKDEFLTQLTGYHLTRGMQAIFKRKKYESIEDICRDADRIAILEEVVNPTNVGAIIRSAAALDIDAVLLTEGCADPLYKRSSRVSMGTVFQIPFTVIEDWPQSVNKLNELGFKTVAMALTDDAVSIDDEKLNSEEKLAIILGTEGDGLKKDTIVKCDYAAKIPMREIVDSLNVAAASAVGFWQLTENKRRKKQ